MRSHKMLAAAAVALLLVGPACSNDSSTPTAGGPNASGSLNQYVTALPDWQQPPEHLTAGTAAVQTVTLIDEPIPDYQCTIQQHDWARATNEVFAPEQDFATLWPGAMFHGRDYKYGTLTTLDLPRSPITVYSNLPGSKSVTVDTPNSVSMNDAINQIRGSVAPENYQSQWEFRVDEVYSNLQGRMEAGLNAGYSEVASGGLSFSENRTVTRHVFFGRAVQRMYTIRFADDQLKTPAEFFDGTVTAGQLQDAGIDDGDVPVYVRSITYGQMIVFKAELNNVESGSGFKADFKAAWDGFTAGGSGGSTGTNLLKQATYEAVGYGGDPGNSANAHSAVAEQKFGTFFDGATVQNAVPLFFEVVTLKDGKPASLGERVVYETWENCKAATGYTLRVKFNRIKCDAKADEKHTYEVDSYCGAAPLVPHISSTSLMNFPQGNHWYTVNKTKECSLNVGSLQKFWVQFWGPITLTAPTWQDQYPFPSIERNLETTWLPTVTFKDGILPGSPERTVTADIRVTLIPTYD